MTPGVTTPTEVLFWRDAPLTHIEILDLIGEEANRHRPTDKPKQVVRIPSTLDEPVLNLSHDEIVSGGTAAHETVTIGESAGLYGYSDGLALQQSFGTITGVSPVSFITGTGTGVGNSITSFTPESVGSHNRGFIEHIREIVIDGTDYTLGDLTYTYGAFHKEIDSGPRITDGDFTYNFRDEDGNAYFTNATDVEYEAGLYWWNPNIGTPVYQRLGQDHFQGTYASSVTYFFGDYVRYLARYWLSVSNNHSGNTPVHGSVHWDQITGLVPEPTSANEGQGLLVDADGDFTLTEVHGTLFGRGEPPEATDARVGFRYLDLISKVLYGCFDDPHRTSESTGDFDDITQTDITINLTDRLEDIHGC